MKILTITSNHPPCHSGGYELRVKDIMDGLAARGHQVLVLSTKAPSRSGKTEALSVYPVRRLLHNRYSAKFFPKEVLLDLIDTKILEKVINEFRPDVIYLGHTYVLSKAILPYLANQNFPLVQDEGGTCLKGAWTERGRWFEFCGDYRSRWAFLNKIKPFVIKLVLLLGNGRIQTTWDWPKAMKVFFNSKSNLDHSLGFDVPVQNAEVIHSGIDLDKFPFLPRARMEEPVKILCPGRLERRKGQLDAIELISMLTAAGIKAELTLVGESISQNYLVQIKSEIASRGLEDSVRILGMVSQRELAKLYQQADICFFSSYHPTGFSRTPLEAMASGCVLITYGNEGSQEVTINQVNGFIVSPGDLEKTREIVQELMSSPPLISKIIFTARRYIEENFSMTAYIDEINAFITKAV